MKRSDEDDTVRLDVAPFVSHYDHMKRLEESLLKAKREALHAGESVKKCLELITQAWDAFEALKE